MRMSLIVLLVALAVPEWAEGKDILYDHPGGGGYVDTHHKAPKDYYVVHKGEEDTDKCSVVSANWGDPPEGALGGAPYASKDYAKTALKKFPECKGGDSDEATYEKKNKKKQTQ